jgi:hypothetical protein
MQLSYAEIDRLKAFLRERLAELQADANAGLPVDLVARHARNEDARAIYRLIAWLNAIQLVPAAEKQA